ncbi:ABC transporter permease subunit [Methanolobus halotolerans]|uniref:ABC transporter n=1 Tax=Methanolobus halotolerans TaxID=2052935 RepID=A0A4E0PTN7_9EURY|nr:ABC transporter permease subunit [Methanolobus halotolerans]TGC08160.1 ABC transporter [Methanolobus halotolerans]
MPGWYTIAKWEFFRSRLKFDVRSSALLIFSLILVIIASFAAAQTDMSMNQRIYSVSTTEPGIEYILESDQRFDSRTVSVYEASNFYQYGNDLAIIGNNAYLGETRKAASAGSALENTVKEYRELVLTSYDDVNNSHPVWVTVHDIERPQNIQLLSAEETAGQLEAGSREMENDQDTGEASEYNREEMTPESIRPGSSFTPPENADELDKYKGKAFFERQKISTPTHFSPPIPFTAILYAFLFIFPIYFVSQFYSTSIMDERTNRKGELMLAAPLLGRDIVIGKTIPYLLITVLIQAAITLYIMGIPSGKEGLQDILLILASIFPVVLLFFALSFFGAILSRSFKELTFASVFLSVIISGYLFFPAMFTNIHAISSISPVTLIVRLIEGESILFETYMFSTFPFYFVALSAFAFGTFIFREEDLFTQKTITEKIVDSFEIFLSHRYGSVFLLSIVFIPFVYMCQLMLIVMLFNLPAPYSVIAMIGLSALAEELVKSAGIYTIYKRKLADPSLKNAARFAILSGAGFFVGEKAVAVLTLAPIASSAFGSVMTMGTLLLIPLILHISTTMISSLGMYRLGTGRYLITVLLATIIHSAYNMFILRVILFG